jgi:hypothetical protein
MTYDTANPCGEPAGGQAARELHRARGVTRRNHARGWQPYKGWIPPLVGEPARRISQNPAAGSTAAYSATFDMDSVR